MSVILRSAQDWIAGLIAVAVLAYLTYTLLRPEKF
jgi:K+-transporting ATPase KdpF subunit